MTDEALASQVDYYRRRADEYDATAYGDVEAARVRIARLVAELRPTGMVLEIACGTGLWTEALAGVADRVTAIDAAPEAVDPEQLEARLRAIGWECRIRRDGDWVIGEARPVTGQASPPMTRR